jgi:hypothetical protein
MAILAPNALTHRNPGLYILGKRGLVLGASPSVPHPTVGQLYPRQSG